METSVEHLIALGFSEKDACIYLALLKKGSATAQELADVLGMPRGTVYSILSNLTARELISCYEHIGEVRRYFPGSPELILRMLQGEHEELRRRVAYAESVIPALSLLFSETLDRPRVRAFEGPEGVRVMQQEYEQLDDDILQMVGFDTFMNLYGDDFSKDHRENIIANPHRSIRSILVTDQKIVDAVSPGMHVITVSPTLFDVRGEMTVCGNRLATFSYDSGIMAVEITSKSIADTARASLELAFKEAERLSKEYAS
ncbi:MAG: winged helix-turn-helix transcriptional regulator [bacterium]|nr:winged helix-turn-helix transcriptional regulator [bacterium]MDA1024524.1 winged helix-turn-helix transcriptional regulator [bacterium]